MLELLQSVLLALTSLGLGWTALQAYRATQSMEVMKTYINYLYTYLLTTAFFVLSAATMGCLPIALVLLAAAGYLFNRIPGNAGRLPFALFLFSIAQQLAYAYLSPQPPLSFMYLAGWYVAGFLFIPLAGIPIGSLLRSRYPEIDRIHQNWLRSKVNDVTFGFEKTEQIIKLSNQYSQNSRFQFSPANITGWLIAYSIWSVLFGLIFYFIL